MLTQEQISAAVSDALPDVLAGLRKEITEQALYQAKTAAYAAVQKAVTDWVNAELVPEMSCSLRAPSPMNIRSISSATRSTPPSIPPSLIRAKTMSTNTKLRAALERVTNILDHFGDLPDSLMDGDSWRDQKAEEAITQAREALADPELSTAPIADAFLHKAQEGEPRDAREFSVRLAEFGVAMAHRQGEKARVLAEVLEAMYVSGAKPAIQGEPVMPGLGDDYEPTMDINAKPGTVVRFRAGGGYPYERESAIKAGFVRNALYTVKRCDIGNSMTQVLVDEIPGRWNSCLFADVASPQASPDGGAEAQQAAPPDFPMGAIENGRVYADRLERTGLECEAGSLLMCADWQEFRRCFEYLAEWALTRSAQAAPQYPECSGDESCCPENEGYGCCGKQAAPQAEVVAYRYKDPRGHWRYVGAPLTKGWEFPPNLRPEPLYATPQASEDAQLWDAYAEGRKDEAEAKGCECQAIGESIRSQQDGACVHGVSRYGVCDLCDSPVPQSLAIPVSAQVQPAAKVGERNHWREIQAMLPADSISAQEPTDEQIISLWRPYMQSVNEGGKSGGILGFARELLALAQSAPQQPVSAEAIAAKLAQHLRQAIALVSHTEHFGKAAEHGILQAGEFKETAWNIDDSKEALAEFAALSPPQAEQGREES